MKTPALDKFQEDIARLERGVELLEKLWHLLGPYGNFPIPEGHKERGEDLKNFSGDKERYRVLVQQWIEEDPNKIWSKIGDYFGFDDSE